MTTPTQPNPRPQHTTDELRRTPIQRRARDTVDVILTAAERVLLEGGYEALSTTRVAKVAGVGIGSLYQYFAGKRELVRGLLASRAQLLEAKLAQLEQADRARLVPLLVAGRRDDRGLFRAAMDGPSHDLSSAPVVSALRRCWPGYTQLEYVTLAAAIIGALNHLALCDAEMLDNAELEAHLGRLPERLLGAPRSRPAADLQRQACYSAPATAKRSIRLRATASGSAELTSAVNSVA